tara:strand:+ start:394 stop:579 length:186 start_codon:yes stop_codon:yes gene_type:complete
LVSFIQKTANFFKKLQIFFSKSNFGRAMRFIALVMRFFFYNVTGEDVVVVVVRMMLLLFSG